MVGGDISKNKNEGWMTTRFMVREMSCKLLFCEVFMAWKYFPELSLGLLKPVDTIGKCQIPVFSLGVPQHMHKITNQWKFELDWSSELRDNYERKTHCHMKLCAFRWLISRPQILNLRSRNQIRGKLLLFRKLLHFRRSSFSQCFIPTSPHYSLPSKVLL